MVRVKVKKKWIIDHRNDFYVKQSRNLGLKSRAAFKLKAIQERDNLFKSGQKVVDLGAAPGSWSQLIVDWVKPHGIVFAVDRLKMSKIPGVFQIVGDFEEQTTRSILLSHLEGVLADVVVSDMSPNLTGHRSVDQAASMRLCQLSADFSQYCLRQGGDFLIKVFQGEESEFFKKTLGQKFSQVYVRKPTASRTRSKEVYFLAKGYMKSDFQKPLR